MHIENPYQNQFINKDEYGVLVYVIDFYLELRLSIL